MVTKVWLVYAKKEPKNESYKFDFSNDDNGVRIIEVLNSDRTGCDEFSILKITRNSEEECIQELYGQESDGIWENDELQREVEIV